MSDELSLEKLRINDRLLSVETKQAQFQVTQDDCHTKICEIHKIIMGSGSTESPGIAIRVDRIEQNALTMKDERLIEDRRRADHQKVIYGGIAAVAVPQLWNFFKFVIGK